MNSREAGMTVKELVVLLRKVDPSRKVMAWDRDAGIPVEITKCAHLKDTLDVLLDYEEVADHEL
jgi:hypothetical protein